MGGRGATYIMTKYGFVTTERFLQLKKDEWLKAWAWKKKVAGKIKNKKTWEDESINEKSERMGDEAKARRGKDVVGLDDEAKKKAKMVEAKEAMKEWAIEDEKVALIKEAKELGINAMPNRGIETVKSKIREAKEKEKRIGR